LVLSGDADDARCLCLRAVQELGPDGQEQLGNRCGRLRCLVHRRLVGGQAPARLCLAAHLQPVRVVARRGRRNRPDRASWIRMTEDRRQRTDKTYALSVVRRLSSVVCFSNCPCLRKRHRYVGTTAAIVVGSMPSAGRVRRSRSASGETTLSTRSSLTWSGVSGGLGRNCRNVAWNVASGNGSGNNSRRRPVVASTNSISSRKVFTSGPPSS